MRVNIVSFAAGAWALQQQAELPGWGWVCVAAALGLIAVMTGRAGGGLAVRLVRRTAGLGACFALGFGWAATMAAWRLADALPPAWEGRDVRIEGVVASLPQPTERSLRFEL